MKTEQRNVFRNVQTVLKWTLGPLLDTQWQIRTAKMLIELSKESDSPSSAIKRHEVAVVFFFAMVDRFSKEATTKHAEKSTT